MQNEGQDEFNMHIWMYLCVCVCARVCFNKVPTAMEYLEIKNVGYKPILEIYLFIYLLIDIEIVAI